MIHEELKPCPFCGEVVVFTSTEMFAGERSPSVIKCRHCNYHVASLGPGSDDTVLTIWNHRPVEDALRAERDATNHIIEDLENLLNGILQPGEWWLELRRGYKGAGENGVEWLGEHGDSYGLAEQRVIEGILAALKAMVKE